MELDVHHAWHKGRRDGEGRPVAVAEVLGAAEGGSAAAEHALRGRAKLKGQAARGGRHVGDDVIQGDGTAELEPHARVRQHGQADGLHAQHWKPYRVRVNPANRRAVAGSRGGVQPRPEPAEQALAVDERVAGAG